MHQVGIICMNARFGRRVGDTFGRVLAEEMKAEHRVRSRTGHEAPTLRVVVELPESWLEERSKLIRMWLVVRVLSLRAGREEEV
jgi:hypothetical protein